MKPQFVFSILRTGTDFLYFLSIALTIVVIAVQLWELDERRERHEPAVVHAIMSVGENFVRYSDFKLKTQGIISGRRQKQSSISNVTFVSTYYALIQLGIVIAIFGLLRCIFRENDLIISFKTSVYKRLIALAVIFAISDLFILVNYFVFNWILNGVLISDQWLIVFRDMIYNLPKALIIYAVAVVYKRGLLIQMENELTV